MTEANSDIKIRKAKPTDMAAVLELIKQLAVYERAPNEVTVTREDLVNDGFSDKLFSCLVAEHAGKVVGMALYYPRYSTWKGRTIHLEDFVVAEAYRNKGIGRQLFDAVVAAAKDFGAKRLEWLVLEWNEPALAFYRKIGAQIDPEWHIGKLDEGQLSAYQF